MYISSPIPPLDCETSDDELERKDDGLNQLSVDNRNCCYANQEVYPLEDVVPTHCEAPRRIDEANGVGVETTGDRVQHSHFTESVHDVEHHLLIC